MNKVGRHIDRHIKDYVTFLYVIVGLLTTSQNKQQQNSLTIN